MNINGKSSNDSSSLIDIGLHVEAIDENGDWSKAEIIDIIDNNLLLKFLDRIEDYNLAIDISSNKWHHIEHSHTKLNNFSFKDSNFEKGDFVLAKWHDDNYYLSQILDISTKTKFGTKVKEYHILYLYDNVHEVVSLSRLKSANSPQEPCNQIVDPSSMNRPLRKLSKRRSDVLDSSHNNDNVFYDEKTKKFTENCKLRRLKLSRDNCDIPNRIVQSNPQIIVSDTSETRVTPSPAIAFIETPQSNCISMPSKRYSQRKRRSSYKKADYFYPDSVDNILKEKNKSSNNNSQVSTPVPFDTNDEIPSSSPKIPLHYSFEVKDCIPSSNHSPISVSLTSTEDSPNLKHKKDSFHQILDEKDDDEFQALYKSNEDGKYQCLICTNKSFRKKQLVFDHIKHYHPTKNDQSNEPIIHRVPKPIYSPNKRYYSSYLKVNRTSIERKRKYNKTKIKSLIKNKTWNIYGNINHKSDYRLPAYNERYFSQLEYPRRATGVYCGALGPNRRQNGSIIYCHRCKKSSEAGYMVQCDVCLCWSHTICYALSENKDSDSFWECDNCASIKTIDGNKTAQWYRDRCRFHSIPKNELPWLTKNAAKASPCSIKNICEMQSFLSLSQRVLEAITLHMDKLSFKNFNDSSSQDDLDILKNICAYDNIEEINITRIDTLESLALNVDNEDLFRVSIAPVIGHCSSLSTISHKALIPDINHSSRLKNSSNFQFSEVAFSNSTPNKSDSNRHKLANSSLDGILDCDIQKLEFIPKADFDALVNDLNLSDDICKTSNSENHSKSSILDFIDDGCKVLNNGIIHDSVPSLESVLSFTQSACLYRNPEIEGCDPMIELSNDDITSLLFEKLPNKSNAICEEVCNQSQRQPNCLSSKYSSDASRKQASGRSRSEPSDSSLHDHGSFVEDAVQMPPNSKMELELADWQAAKERPGNGHADTMRPSVLADSDPLLSVSDSKCLRWLESKYNCVERIVESVEQALLSGSSDGEAPASLEEEFCQMSRYLHSLLYILRRDREEFS